MSQQRVSRVSQQADASLMNFSGAAVMEKGERQPRLRQTRGEEEEEEEETQH